MQFTTTLYKIGNSGLLYWQAKVDDLTLTITHGLDAGAKQTETDIFPSHELARKEYNRRIAIKMSKQGYTQHIPETSVDLCMLATDYSPHHTPLHVYVQPKLDGIRCIATNSTMITRRREKIVSLPHIMEALKSLPPGITLDGELYCHGKDFQKHLSWIKRNEVHENHEQIRYRVFDIQTNVPFALRVPQFFNIVKGLNSPFVEIVPTQLTTKDKLPEWLEHFSDYEGIMVRDPDGLYEKDKHSRTLQKLKRFEDGEFEIVGIKAATTGRERGAAILECKIGKGESDFSKRVNKRDSGVLRSGGGESNTFSVRPKGSLDFRRHIYKNKEQYIGLFTRVTYCGRTVDGKPKQATAQGYFSRPEAKP